MCVTLAVHIIFYYANTFDIFQNCTISMPSHFVKSFLYLKFRGQMVVALALSSTGIPPPNVFH